MEAIRPILEKNSINDLVKNSKAPEQFTSIRKPLREWGFVEAGVNRGDPMALESNLRAIREGHLVDENHNAEEENKRKNHPLFLYSL